METQTNTIVVGEPTLKAVQYILNSKEKCCEEEKNDIIETFTTVFEEGVEVDIKICNGDPPYVDAVLFDNGREVCVLETRDTLLGNYEFEYQDRRYVVFLVRKREEIQQLDRSIVGELKKKNVHEHDGFPLFNPYNHTLIDLTEEGESTVVLRLQNGDHLIVSNIPLSTSAGKAGTLDVVYRGADTETSFVPIQENWYSVSYGKTK